MTAEPDSVVHGWLDAEGLWYAGGRIDALVACAGSVSRTSQAESTRIGVARVHRGWTVSALEVEHVVFAPGAVRPILLSCVALRNPTSTALLVHYSELWDVQGESFRAAESACELVTSDGNRALADLAAAPRARVPAPPAESGLSLDVRIVVPPEAVRELTFGYIATPPGDDPAVLAQAWRGGVKDELTRCLSRWREALGAEPLEAYRRAALALDGD